MAAATASAAAPGERRASAGGTSKRRSSAFGLALVSEEREAGR
jgi:hypothetical protein